MVPGFLKKNSCEKVWTIIFATDLILYAFVESSISNTTFMGGEYLNFAM